MAPLWDRPDPSKLINSIIFDPIWAREVLDNILTSIVSNSHFGKRPGARDMSIFGSHVGPHIPNIGYLEAYEGI